MAGEPWDDALGAPEGLVGGSSPSLAARLDRWLADARIESSADERARERWLTEAADADATFDGLLLDLAERGTPLAIATTAGRRWRGFVHVLGADFVSVRVPAGGEVLLATNAISSVRTAHTDGRASGERPVTTDLRLGDVLGELAADRDEVRLLLRDGADAISGTLRSVGQDVVTLRTQGEGAGTAFVPLGAIAEVGLA